MSLPKHSLTFLPYCVLPLLLLAGFNYWSTLRTVDASLSSQAQSDLNSLAASIDRRLQEEEVVLFRAALSDHVRQILTQTGAPAHVAFNGTAASPPANSILALSAVLRGSGHSDRVAIFDQNRAPVLQLERLRNVQSGDTFTTRIGEASISPDSSQATRDKSVLIKDSTLQYSIPISGGGPNERIGTLISELSLNELIADTSRVLTIANSPTANETFIIAIDQSAHIVYASNRNFPAGGLVSSVLPEFLPIADSISANKSGLTRFQVSNGSGSGYVTAFAPLPRWNIGLAVGRDRSASIANAHRTGIFELILALVTGVALTVALSYVAQKRSGSMERVEEELSAIAKGELDRHIELKSSDDARGIADSINLMAEKMRAQIAREEETRQFQSFVRLSAVLTHDLKNAIEALSLIVGNMERHFDNEQFRRDALKSLMGATDKLKGIVARLTRPLTSLSGEHPTPRSVDLVPMLRRIAAMTAEPQREKHEIEINLPPKLFVFTDAERMEKVIENLILNALESMGDKRGKLTIEAGVSEGRAATFSITDTGVGMTKDFVDNKLFRAFSTTKKHGVGLGLYTCREVVEASAGSIEVESVTGAGTTFRVVLPSASHDSRN
jgi:signal transduction histidine kinase